MSARLTARDRMARLLSVIPWVSENDGASVDEISARFDYPRDQLLKDLREVVLFVGVHPFTPDTLIEVDIADDRVQIRYADWFHRPLRITADDGARLLTAGRSMLAMEPDDDEHTGPLLRALAKLELALGDGAGSAVEVRLGDAPDATLRDLRRALDNRTQLDIEYYAYGRDELTRRRVDPARIFSDSGNWYLSGWCHRAGAERVFRVDRMRSVAVTDDPVTTASEPGPDVSFSPSGDDPRMTLRLAESARWVADTYPTESVVGRPDGSLDIVIAVTARPWLERLLLRLGDAAEIIDADPGIGPDVARTAAARVLGRYRDAPGVGKGPADDSVVPRD